MTEWTSGDVTLYCAPCEEILPTLGKVDAVITDPPYDMTMGGGGLGAKRQYVQDIKATGLADGFDVAVLGQFTNWMCFCAKKTIVALIQQAEKQSLRWQLITWNKTNPTPLCNRNYLPDTEYIVHAFERLPDCEYRDKSRWIVGAVEQNDFAHPTVKPLYVMERLLRSSTVQGDTVLDPYAGTGTTLVAAVRLGRKAIGIEREESYFEIAKKRILKAQNDAPLFDKPRVKQAKLGVME